MKLLKDYEVMKQITVVLVFDVANCILTTDKTKFA